MAFSNLKAPEKEPQARLLEAVTLTGSRSCGKLKYHLKVGKEDEARATLCHCKACKKATRGVFNITVKVPLTAF